MFLSNFKTTVPKMAMAFSSIVCGAVISGSLMSLLAISDVQSQTARQPRVLQIAPAADVKLPEQAAFALLLNKPLTGKPQAQCDVWGIRSAIPTELVTGARRTEVLKSYGLEKEVNNEKWIVLRCQVAFPDGANMSLNWKNPEPPASREEVFHDGWDGQSFGYAVASDLPVSVECERSNAGSGCSPLSAVELTFTQNVNAAHATKIVLKDKQGKRYVHEGFHESTKAISAIRFKNLPVSETLTVEWPASLDVAGGFFAKSLLTPAARAKPLTIRMGPYPPLVKFAATFGVAEKAIGGIVPLTVRAVENAKDGKDSKAGSVKLRQLKVSDEAGIIEVMRTLRRISQIDGSVARTYTEEGDPSEANSERTPKAKLRYPFDFSSGGDKDVDARERSWLKSQKSVTLQDLPKQLESAAFEVLGVPLKESGLYLLEAESVYLGRGLLGKDKPMFVRSGALVTDLAAHLHLASQTAAVWVTQLSTGKPVAAAQVSIYDCNAKKISQGLSNAQGWVQLDGKYPESWSCPFYAFAKKDGDLSFVQSNWQQGIQSWRFEGLKNLNAEVGNNVVHTVLARNLLKGGETLHAKHFWRSINGKGELSFPRRADLPTTLNLVHAGSNEKTAVAVTWDARGNATTVHKLPEGAKRGAYTIEFIRPMDADQVSRGLSGSVESATFRIEDFRLPVLKAEVVSPTRAHIGEKFNVMLRLNYLSGGAAAGEKVQISQRLLRHTPRFEGYDNYYFGVGNRWAEEGMDDAIESDTDTSANTANKQNTDDKSHTLSANGTLSLATNIKKSNGRPKTLLTEMEYRDPNGETYRAQGRTVVWPSSVMLGYKMDYWAEGAGKERKVEFVALTGEGKPAANAAIEVQGAYQGYVTHRRKTIGGYYSYHWERINEPYKPLCKGRSDAAGRFTCSFKPKLDDLDSGEFSLQATVNDAKGGTSSVQTSLYLYNGEEVWFSQSDHDRMDVLTDKPKLKIGETAVLQVRSPFREATAWVNVMRSGAVIDTIVVPLSGKNPTISLPMKANYAPNVFINVMAVRGRVADPGPTALVDLARPAFKLGLTHLDVISQEHELKVAVSTDKKSYQSRETAVTQIQVNPPAGKALPADREVTVFAIDEALLELLPNDTWNVLQTMFAQRGYGFESASMNMQVLGKRHYGRKALPAGGGGGRSPARELFETLLLWQSTVKLDAQGHATVRVPINDSLTRFRVIAVANAGADLFGTGHASFTASKDLQILSGLPQSAREGDGYAAGFTLRNTTAQSMNVSATATAGGVTLSPQNVALAAGEAKTIYWPAVVPQEAKQMDWRVDAKSNTGRTDAIIIKQPITPALTPLRYTLGAQSLENGSASFVNLPPQGTVPGRGEVRVSLSPAFATDAAGVRDYMRSYPFYCLEQRTSKAVSLRDPALWGIISGTIDQYVTPSGLVNYYPGQNGYDQGYDVLTSFVLSASHEAKFKLPVEAQNKMLDGLVGFVSGKLQRSFDYYGSRDDYELTERKLLALEALSRYRIVPQALTESLKLTEADLPKLSNRGVVQWVDILTRSEFANKASLLPVALKELNARLGDDGKGGLKLKAKSRDNSWYWMYSDEATAARAALLALDQSALKDKAEGITRGAINMQRGGSHWWQTQANVWGSLMLDKRAQQSAVGIAGISRMTLGDQTLSHDWSKLPQGQTYTLPLVQGDVKIAHEGAGKPYATAYGTAWAHTPNAHSKNASVSKTIRPIKQAVAGVYSAGDVLEVQIKFGIGRGMGWVAVTDPIPTGATLLGGGLKGLGTVENGAANERRGWRNSDGSYEAYPAYIERTATVIRGYFEYLWNENNTMTYQVRINNPGTFKLPPTQVEAMYDPDHFAYLPNAPIVVK